MQQAVSSTSTDAVAYDQLQQRVLDAMSSGDPDAYVACFAADGMLMPPGAQMITGKQAIRVWIAGLFSRFNVTVEVSRQELHFTSDWAIERHNYVVTATPKQGGGTQVDRGKAVVISKRSPDGSWNGYIDCWNGDNPPAAAQ